MKLWGFINSFAFCIFADRVLVLILTGKRVDAVKFDFQFTCDCSGTGSNGDNCEVAVSSGDSLVASVALSMVSTAIGFVFSTWQ